MRNVGKVSIIAVAMVVKVLPSHSKQTEEGEIQPQAGEGDSTKDVISVQGLFPGGSVPEENDLPVIASEGCRDTVLDAHSIVIIPAGKVWVV